MIWAWKTCSFHGLEFRFRNSIKIFCTHLDTIVWNWFFIEQIIGVIRQDNVILHKTAEESQKENLLFMVIDLMELPKHIA